jgi:sialidase-1
MNRRTFLKAGSGVSAGVILAEAIAPRATAADIQKGGGTAGRGLPAWFEQTDVFVGGTEGYHTFRIPAIVVSPRGVILAFCEGRKFESQDAGKIDLVLKRSHDGGKTWGPLQILATGPDRRCGDPVPLVERKTGAVLIVYMKFPATLTVPDLLAGKGPKNVMVSRSTDDGATWGPAKDITAQVRGPGWDTYATGPCHGLQLASGRLIVPCYHLIKGQTLENEGEFNASHLIYSDDGGEIWKVGGIAPQASDECVAVETADGSVYLNMRYEKKGATMRLEGWSRDHGATLTDIREVPELLDPQCQGSAIRFTEAKTQGRNRVLFSNLVSRTRDHLRVSLSYDECKSWPSSKLINEGPAGYSDLAIHTDQSVLCLYERGLTKYYERITLARFSLEWLTENGDRLSG